jgi:uncharacterized membrane protein YhaH (DUF805 family)
LVIPAVACVILLEEAVKQNQQLIIEFKSNILFINHLTIQKMNNVIDNFKQVVMDKYADFTGRANRREYWLFVLAVIVISLVLWLFTTVFAKVKLLYILFAILYGAVSLALLIPSLAVTVRRLHDIGKGGGWIFISLIPIIGAIWLLILLIKYGETDENRFGKPVN